MKRFFAIALAATVGFIAYAGTASAATFADYPNGVAANGIGGSRHNLGSYGIHVITDGTSEICVFCHAPHHGSPDTGPLWNRVNAANGGYQAYGDTIAGTTVGAPGGATLACLSCHDGITTFDTLINAPGKGNNGSNNKTATDMGWSFTEDGTAKGDKLNSTRLTIGASYYEAPGTDTMVDLRDDHPVSVAYTAGKASLRPTGTTLSSIDLTDGLNATGQADQSMQQNRWSVGGSITDSASISALLRGASGNVECSSCHDPHFSNKSWDETESTWGGEVDSDGLFLRRVGGNTGSGVCRTCHNK